MKFRPLPIRTQRPLGPASLVPLAGANSRRRRYWFAPADSKGLGMKIVQSLVKRIGGALHISSDDNGRGMCITAT